MCLFWFALIVCDCDEWRRGLLGGYQHPLYKFFKLTHVMVGILMCDGCRLAPERDQILVFGSDAPGYIITNNERHLLSMPSSEVGFSSLQEKVVWFPKLWDPPARREMKT